MDRREMLMDTRFLRSASAFIRLHIPPGSCRKGSKNPLAADCHPVSQGERVLYPSLVNRLVGKPDSGPKDVSPQSARKGQMGT